MSLPEEETSSISSAACTWLNPAASRAASGDYVVCLGAGNITQWAAALPGELGTLLVFDTEGRRLLERDLGALPVADWLDENGEPKSEDEKKTWSDSVEAARPYDSPDKKDWFIGVCAEAGCDPATSTLFDYLETDDKLSFAK